MSPTKKQQQKEKKISSPSVYTVNTVDGKDIRLQN